MDELETVRENILDLIHSDLSASQISRNADIPLTTVTRLRNGDIDINNVSFKNIAKLFYASNYNEKETK